MWNDKKIDDIERLNWRLIIVWKWLTVLLVLRVLWGILYNYPSYFPADFTSHFLVEHEKHFQGIYRTAFFIHIVSAPIALVAGLFLMSVSSRRWLPKIHRIVGRVQIVIVCMAVAPSGLVMSFYSLGGIISTVAFLFLSVLTCATSLLGFRSALFRRFEEHQRWMWRCWVLLSSAIVLRLLTMVLTPFGWDPVALYRFTAWISWLMPLMILELANWLSHQARKSSAIRENRSRLLG